MVLSDTHIDTFKRMEVWTTDFHSFCMQMLMRLRPRFFEKPHTVECYNIK